MANIPLKTLTFPGLDDTYTIPQIDTTLAVSGKAADAKATGDAIADVVEDVTEVQTALETKAAVDGAYESMTVGNAEQLVSTQYTEDKVPYLFRTSGGSADIGNREEDMIVGGTVAWNQLAVQKETITTNGITFTNNGDGSYTLNGTATANAALAVSAPIPVGHKVYFHGCPAGGDRTTYHCIIGFVGYDTGSGLVGNAAQANQTMNIQVMSGTTVNNLTFTPQLYDLTAMFGSTIADYIYSLEQANAGAGVAWFKKLFPKSYYPYDAGTLKSVEGLTSHDTVGFNAWDEEWEVGTLNISTGQNESNNARIRSKNYISIVPNTTYCFRQGEATSAVTGRVCYYDEEKNFISGSSTFPGDGNAFYNPATFTTPDNAYYMRFSPSTTYGTTYKNDICINLSWSGYRNGEYEPYTKHSYPLDSTLTLRGIPKLDASGNLYYDGDTYEPDGTVTRRYGAVDLGTLTWAAGTDSVGQFFQTTVSGIKNVSASGAIANAICTKYPISSSNNVYDKSLAVGAAAGSGRIYARDVSYTDVATFKTDMSGVMLVYELATPTTESASPYQTPQVVDNFGTEEYVTDSIVPVGHVTQYMANLRDKLQHLPDLADSDGYYVIQQTDSQMDLVHFRIPQAPVENGTYILKATVSGGTPTYTWEVAE